MLFLIVNLVLIIFNTNPAQTDEINHFSTPLSSSIILHKILDSKNLMYRGNLGYKKSTITPFTGKITGKEEGYLKNGMWDGPYVSYYNTGQIEHKGSYNRGKREGPWKSFRADGNIMSDGNYYNGLYEGTWKFYHLFGTNLQILKNFKNGKKDGGFQTFYGNGNLMQEGSYKNGKPTGLWIFYGKNGIKERNRKIY
jgi:antitoxin component YwqK of YwqJK toxin-antitoxin module